jgi:hypothetical protein
MGASTGLKVRQIDFSDWWGGLFHTPPYQATTAAIDRFTR